ncbi:MAG: cell division protein FtsL [Anaerovibrio sp.]|uniref:cell division protein FtsL n=1 Tax=uncultured Anaerovibrio sp. TaxID=361586 RepID=UPI00261F5EC9|nr:cell division protein FtsL [uncultured Anaerovibrio sp.]MBQ1855388.1 cell division protein FtsL [Anaerovibrio sp.]
MLARQLVEEEYFEELPQQQQKIIRRRVVRRNAHEDPRRKQALCLFVLGALIYGLILWFSSCLASEVYEVGRIQAEASGLEKSNEDLKVENAKLKSHSRIKEIAVNQLGMTVPQENYFAGSKAKN